MVVRWMRSKIRLQLSYKHNRECEPTKNYRGTGRQGEVEEFAIRQTNSYQNTLHAANYQLT
ncbi:MAG TPA: hypothetical protein VGN12_22705 [Pirellulales bacterium]|jgi:hypothetical protein